MDEPVFPLLSISRLRMGTDGVGITTLIAGAGCPLHCRWCINERLLQEAAPESVTAPQLLETVRKDDLYFQATGGGITFGGGESLLHASFIRRFRELCPPEWKLFAETSLNIPEKNVLTVLNSVDLFIVDCKDLNPEIYHSYTGGDSEQMTDNLRLLVQTVGPERILARVPVIPGYNTKEDQTKSADELRSMGLNNLDLFDYVIRK